MGREEFLARRREIAERRAELDKFIAPVSRVMLNGGLQTRPMRQEIKRFNGNIKMQKLDYTKQISDMDAFLSPENRIAGKSLIEPNTCIHNLPSLKPVRNIFGRKRWS